jgi:hypothetical protein
MRALFPIWDDFWLLSLIRFLPLVVELPPLRPDSHLSVDKDLPPTPLIKWTTLLMFLSRKFWL